MSTLCFSVCFCAWPFGSSTPPRWKRPIKRENDETGTIRHDTAEILCTTASMNSTCNGKNQFLMIIRSGTLERYLSVFLSFISNLSRFKNVQFLTWFYKCHHTQEQHNKKFKFKLTEKSNLTCGKNYLLSDNSVKNEPFSSKFDPNPNPVQGTKSRSFSECPLKSKKKIIISLKLTKSSLRKLGNFLFKVFKKL